MAMFRMIATGGFGDFGSSQIRTQRVANIFICSKLSRPVNSDTEQPEKQLLLATSSVDTFDYLGIEGARSHPIAPWKQPRLVQLASTATNFT